MQNTISSSSLASSGPIGVDFETYYTGDYSVSVLGYYAYTHDPRFQAFLVAASDGENSIVCPPVDFNWDLLNGREWVSHNREFDRFVLERLQEQGKIPAGVKPSVWHCSAAASASIQLPRNLAGAAQAVLGVTLDKSTRLKMKDANLGLFPEDVLEYAATDAKTCVNLWRKIERFWGPVERRLYGLTCEMGERGVCLDLPSIEEGKKGLTKKVTDIDSSLPFSPSTSVKAFREACIARGFPLPRSTAESSPDYQKWLRQNIDTDAAMWARLMQDRRSLNRKLKVLDAMTVRIKSDGRMAYELKYYGASPGRWSGGGGLNLQNFNRDADDVDLRGCIVPPAGKVLGVVDFAQIEARVILLLAGDHKTLELLRDGMDLYEAHARATMQYMDPQPLKKINPKLRQLAKARVLGLGFGCGADKFIEVAKIMGGIELSFEESRKTVFEYRNSNPKVVKLWGNLEAEFKRHHGKNYCLPFPCNTTDPTRFRRLIYRHIDAEEMTCTIGGDRVGMYGGKLAENWTQGTARDIFAEAWIRCVDAGFSPVMGVHDELVFELEEKTAKEQLEQIVKLMEQPPAWAASLPVKAEGLLMPRYAK